MLSATYYEGEFEMAVWLGEHAGWLLLGGGDNIACFFAVCDVCGDSATGTDEEYATYSTSVLTA